jgi:hypothetical protein
MVRKRGSGEASRAAGGSLSSPSWSKGVKLATFASTLAVLLALRAYHHLSPGEYSALRWLICGASLTTAYFLRRTPLALVSSLAVAVLFHPIAPFRMAAYEWQRYDLGTAIVMGTVTAYNVYLQFVGRQSPMKQLCR